MTLLVTYPAPSTRSHVVTKRTYTRPITFDGEHYTLEDFKQLCLRVINHQRWLWERQLKRKLTTAEEAELTDLFKVLMSRRGALAGRTYWLGGTDKARECECSQFNCSYLNVETVHDVVDAFWLLLNGCGVGFKTVPGCLFGYADSIPELKVIDSTRGPDSRGNPSNHEDYDNGVWTLQIGDSAVAWAKAIGKLLAGKYRNCRKLVLDFSQIRGPGRRLRGYGWICHGSEPLRNAMLAIHSIMNDASGRMLAAQESHDILNWLGTVLSTRRSAQIALCDEESPWLYDFISFKEDDDQWQRHQSNNTVNFYSKPDAEKILEYLQLMDEGGKGEPGMRNVAATLKRAPWSTGTNPCAEILLPNKGFCNLVEINLAHADHHDDAQLLETIKLLSRANYRQTCVRLDNDPILQRAWHENNQNIRLCGVGLTGIAQRPDIDSGDRVAAMRDLAVHSAHSMADELGTPRSQAVTTIKPSGTMSKVMDCTEGVHTPVGEYVFNRVAFKRSDPLVEQLRAANYTIEDHPYDPVESVLVVLPVHYAGVAGTDESAVNQLDRYAFYQKYWANHNVSCTVRYDANEIPAIGDWMNDNWDNFIGVSFFPRGTEANYKYLPQEPVTPEQYHSYVDQLLEISEAESDYLSSLEYMDYDPDEAGESAECAGGSCPIR